MSEAKLCDICEKPITARQSILFNSGLYEQYKVKVHYIKEGWSMAGYFSKKETLDVCPTCMNKFVKFAKEENSGAE